MSTAFAKRLATLAQLQFDQDTVLAQLAATGKYLEGSKSDRIAS